MTWSHGYFCPKCECRWVKHLCKEKLPCGCGVAKEDAVYIYTKWYAKTGLEVYIHYKGLEVEAFIPHDEDDETALKRLLDKVKNHPQEELLKKAIEDALYGRSLYWKDWMIRCSKCKHFTSPYHKKKCEIHDWCSIDCRDFERK